MEKKAVVYIFYDKNTDKFLVENRTKDQFLAGEKLFPGGKVEQNELNDLTKTLIREAKEELGVTITKYVELNPVITGLGGFRLYCFLVTSWSGRIPKIVLDKGSVLEWIDRKTFVPNLKPVRKILKLANNSIV
ncbi:MAG: NUDIX domain-containing protein [Candidatus Woesebacteria bacterium]|nr:NUDIX domain-containing protein [Candidatus Woesebacteria bacterium]